MPKTVHVVFKTHLDVGFTDYAAVVVRRYIEQYIPAAMRLARDLRATGGAERFIWTTGSWLIYEYLEHAAPAARREMEGAIAAGDIRWHALPFTTHSEMMDAGLFRFGLGLSQELDRRFGLQTVAAKMTDVPGHSRGIVPLLAEAGVQFLHIGVNPACRAPDVPDVFRWRDAASSAEVVVMYHKANYGSAMTLAGLDHAIAFAHTGDNCGPQSQEQIVTQFARLREQFPGDTVVASSMEPLAAALWQIRDRLPVVEQELGDTWIHGLGTDPAKVGRFRALSRLRQAWMTDGRAARHPDAVARFSRKLLMIPEHTWGQDVKTHLGDWVNWTRPQFEAARRRDLVDAPVPPEIGFVAKFRKPGPRRYSGLEKSWAEQRAYLRDAVKALAGTELEREARAALAALTPRRALAGTGWRDLAPDETIETEHFAFAVNPASGAIVKLTSRDTGRAWADPDHPLALLRYQTFSVADYERYVQSYCINMEHHWCSDWAIPDISKPGLRTEDSPQAFFNPVVPRLRCRRTAAGLQVVADLAFAESANGRFGAPARARIEYSLPKTGRAIDMRLAWFDKPANRMPEALWLSFVPAVAESAGWTMDKLGSRVSPLDVLRDGNRNLHGVGRGVTYAGPEGEFTIETLDAPLVAPGRPRLLWFDNSLPDLRGGMHFNLYNNLWGTNFPMWYEDNALFRFRVRV